MPLTFPKARTQSKRYQSATCNPEQHAVYPHVALVCSHCASNILRWWLVANRALLNQRAERVHWQLQQRAPLAIQRSIQERSCRIYLHWTGHRHRLHPLALPCPTIHLPRNRIAHTFCALPKPLRLQRRRINAALNIWCYIPLILLRGSSSNCNKCACLWLLQLLARNRLRKRYWRL